MGDVTLGAEEGSVNSFESHPRIGATQLAPTTPGVVFPDLPARQECITLRNGVLDGVIDRERRGSEAGFEFLTLFSKHGQRPAAEAGESGGGQRILLVRELLRSPPLHRLSNRLHPDR